MPASTKEEVLARDVCKDLLLPPTIRPDEDLDQPVDAFLDQVIERREYSFALRVLACALPIRESIWWGLLCVWKHAGGRLKPKDENLLRDVFYWVHRPTKVHHELVRLRLRGEERRPTPAMQLARAVRSAGFAPAPDEPLTGNASNAAVDVANAISSSILNVDVSEHWDAAYSAACVGIEIRDHPKEWVEGLRARLAIAEPRDQTEPVGGRDR